MFASPFCTFSCPVKRACTFVEAVCNRCASLNLCYFIIASLAHLNVTGFHLKGLSVSCALAGLWATEGMVCLNKVNVLSAIPQGPTFSFVLWFPINCLLFCYSRGKAGQLVSHTWISIHLCCFVDYFCQESKKRTINIEVNLIVVFIVFSTGYQKGQQVKFIT